MTSDDPGRPRQARSPEVVERLQRSQDRLRQRRAVARERERAVRAAVKEYIAAWQAITGLEQDCDHEVSRLERQMVEARQRAQAGVAEHRHRQARAALAIREQGHRDEDIAELLEITVKQARQLMAIAASQSGKKPHLPAIENTAGTAAGAAPTPTVVPSETAGADSGPSTTIRDRGVRVEQQQSGSG